MMAVNRYRLKHSAQRGNRGAKLALALLKETDRLLGVILLGNTLVAAAAATLTAVITKRLFGEGELALALGTVAISFVLLVFSEITPKVVGAAHADRLAPLVSFVLTPMLKAAKPIVWFVNLFVQALLTLLRPPYFVPAGTPLLTQLQQFQADRQRLGLVVDEYGELQGLVTIEDIVEEIIGEFTTQAPGGTDSFRREADGSVVVDGMSLLRSLNRRLGTQFPLDGPKTLNGLIVEHLGDIPDAGVSFKVAGQGVEILQTIDRAVKVVRLLPPVGRAAAPLQTQTERASSSS